MFPWGSKENLFIGVSSAHWWLVFGPTWWNLWTLKAQTGQSYCWWKKSYTSWYGKFIYPRWCRIFFHQPCFALHQLIFGIQIFHCILHISHKKLGRISTPIANSQGQLVTELFWYLMIFDAYIHVNGFYAPSQLMDTRDSVCVVCEIEKKKPGRPVSRWDPPIFRGSSTEHDVQGKTKLRTFSYLTNFQELEIGIDVFGFLQWSEGLMSRDPFFQPQSEKVTL